MKKTLSRLAAAVGLAAAATVSTPAFAGIGDPLYAASTGNIVVTFLGSDAGYNSALQVGSSGDFFNNFSTPVGATYDLGSFQAGQLIDVVLHVISTGQYFHSGPASGNPDEVPHANVIFDYQGVAGVTYVGFEDLYGGGDGDYNDLNFSFTNLAAVPPVAAVPEPETVVLMLAGLGALGWVSRRRRVSRG